MTPKQFYDLLYAVWNDGDGGIEDIRSYSGRAMYGDRCIAVTGDDLDMFALGVAMADAARNECGEDEARLHLLLGELKRVSSRTDSMGRGTVLYWPRLAWDDEEMDEVGDER